MNALLNSLVDKAQSLHISQAVQLSINSAFLSEFCLYLQSFIAAYPDPPPGSEEQHVMIKPLNSYYSFVNSKNKCQDLIYELIQAKISQVGYIIYIILLIDIPSYCILIC